MNVSETINGGIKKLVSDKANLNSNNLIGKDKKEIPNYKEVQHSLNKLLINSDCENNEIRNNNNKYLLNSR